MVFTVIGAVLLISVVLKTAGKFTRKALGWLISITIVAMLLRHYQEVWGLICHAGDSLWPVILRGAQSAINNCAELMNSLFSAL